MFFIEVETNTFPPSSPGEKLIIARGDLIAMTHTFPVVVASAMERGYRFVGLYDEHWELLAEWSWTGLPVEAPSV